MASKYGVPSDEPDHANTMSCSFSSEAPQMRKYKFDNLGSWPAPTVLSQKTLQSATPRHWPIFSDRSNQPSFSAQDTSNHHLSFISHTARLQL
ncbi:hypothetical protein V6N13_115250 [Hibiscus sabdariffa]|uniref:Uncharacterized protein n=1 Tax=Hibiscus sabdariffa TaxID=183260 RepID=A0ABR2CR75_9ROSI